MQPPATPSAGLPGTGNGDGFETTPLPDVRRGVARPQIEMLDPATRALLAHPDAQDMQVAAGGIILAEGDQNPPLAVIRSGWAARCKSLPDGRRQILAFLLPGDLIGFQAQFAGAAATSVEAITDVHLRSCRPDSIRRPADAVAAHVIALMAVKQIELQDALLSLGQRTAAERMAALFLDLFERAASRQMLRAGALPMPLTQSHLSAALGVSPVHANRVIGKLQRSGAVRLQRGRLQILDLGLLCEAALRPMPAALAQIFGRPTSLPTAAPVPHAAPAKRILVVEDEFFLAHQVEDILVRMGLEVVGPCASLQEAIRISETQPLDAALLDVHLGQDALVYPVAEQLRRRNIPFSFLTGYLDHDLGRFPAEQVLSKPFQRKQLELAVEGLIR